MTDRNTDDETDGVDDETPDSTDDTGDEDDILDDILNERGEHHDDNDDDSERVDRDDGFDRENGFERKNTTVRDDGFEHEDAVEQAGGTEREDELVDDGREEGMEASEPPGEPGRSSADEYGEPPQYFEPAAETSEILSRSAESLRSKMLALRSSEEQSTDGESDDDGASTPPGLVRARKVGTALDDAITIPGTSFQIGLDPILGILPGAGDAVAAVGSLYIVLEAARAGVPRAKLMKMLALVAVDLVAGSVPVVGVLFDALWKSNKWNVAAFEEHVKGDGH